MWTDRCPLVAAMRRRQLNVFLVLVCVPAWARAGGDPVASDAAGVADLYFGGCGGVYLLAGPGELVIDVAKRDRNLRGGPTELRAILVGPDRRVLGEATIADDGRPKGSGLGPPQSARLSTRVERKGVFALNITVSRDRYGQEMVWGFRTNCPRYLVETSRGHKDERHQEPIVLESPGKPADLCFLPRRDAFAIEVSGLRKGADALRVLSRDGALIETLEVDPGGRASGTFPAGSHREAVPWRLHLPSARAVVHIDGVTRWGRDDPHQDLCYWTPDRSSWFPLLEYRWLLTPYRRIVHGEPGAEREVRFQVHSNSHRRQAVRLALEFPDARWPARLSKETVVLGSKGAAHVTVRCEVPPSEEHRFCHVRATPVDRPEFSTYSTVVVVAGDPSASRPLDLPIRLKPYRHENEQFGYLPDYPVESQVYFDGRNRPFLAMRGGLASTRNREWVTRDLGSAVTSRTPPFEGESFRPATTKVAFDRENDVYLLATCGGTAALLHSSDGGETFAAHAIPGRRGVLDMEQFSGHNVPEGPPPFVRFVRTARDPKLIWRRINDLELFLPRKAEAAVRLGEPILLSRECIGLSAHSGIPSSVVSRGAKVHTAWGEATDPQKPVPGVPTYVATYDRDAGKLGEPALVGYGPPPNDVHNSPSITIDSRGYLHVLIGTHGRPFQHVQSLEPNDAGSGWTEPARLGEGLRQTYVGLVCGEDDTLHAVFRLWRSGEQPFPLSTHATLAHQRKPPGEPWGPPRILVVSPFSEYSIFYHRLTIDRRGHLFLSYDYWSTYWFYRLDHYGSRRALLTSPDGGDTWKLAGSFP